MSAMDTLMQNELNKFLLHQKVEESLSVKLGIPSLRAGNITIRDHRDWRINEKQIEYCWLINISRSFVGWCWLFTIGFNETKFRGIVNPTELIQGIFTIDDNGAIADFYKITRDANFQDDVKGLTAYDLFSANPGIPLDGVGYEYIIFGHNSKVRMTLNNPDTKNWKIWEEAVWKLGADLSKRAGSRQLEEIFR